MRQGCPPAARRPLSPDESVEAQGQRVLSTGDASIQEKHVMVSVARVLITVVVVMVLVCDVGLVFDGAPNHSRDVCCVHLAVGLYGQVLKHA